MGLIWKYICRPIASSSNKSILRWGQRRSLALVLRPYQEECIQACLSNMAQGRKRLGVSLATGSGKTVIFTQLISRVSPVSTEGNRTLILVHRRELVEQAAKHCMEAYPNLLIEVEMANSHASGAGDITVASVQSLVSGDRMHKFDPRTFKLILIDEAHHAASPSYMRVLEYFGASSPETKVNVVGVSATLSRFDGLRLGAALDYICYHRLCDVKFTTVATNVDLTKVKNGKFGDFDCTQLSKAVNTDNTNELIVRTWLDRALGKRKSTMVFCVDIAHVQRLTTTFRRHGVDARYVTSHTLIGERKELVSAFRNGEYPVLVNCGVFTEGTDIPTIDCVLLTRPTRSRNLLVQMIGRGMRLFPSKRDCHVIDFVSSLEAGIVTVPTLFGLDPTEIVSAQSAESLRAMALDEDSLQQRSREENANKMSISSKPSYNTVSYCEFDVQDLIIEESKEDDGKRIRQYSQLAWTHVGHYKYVLSIASHGSLKIDQTEDGSFFVTETRNLPAYVVKEIGHKNARARVLVENATFEQAVHGADTYATSKVPRTLVHRYASWRSSPATTEQLAFLNKFRSPNRQLSPDEMSKGVAGDLITKIRHGAIRMRREDNRKRRKQEDILKKERERKSRETVRVGPVAN